MAGKAENRSCQIAINIEPSFYILVQKIMDAENINTVSDYGRKLILWDLVDKGLISAEDVMRIIIGGNKSPRNDEVLTKTS